MKCLACHGNGQYDRLPAVFHGSCPFCRGGGEVKARGKVDTRKPHPNVSEAAQALIGVAWRKEKDSIPGAVDRVLDEMKKHPTPNAEAHERAVAVPCSLLLAGPS